MKRMIGLTIILLATAGCVSVSKPAQKPTQAKAAASDQQTLEDRMGKLEAQMQLTLKDYSRNWVLEQRIKNLEKLILPEHSIIAAKDKQAPNETMNFEGRVVKLEGQVKQLQTEIADFYKRQRLEKLIPIDPDPKPKIIPVK